MVNCKADRDAVIRDMRVKGMKTPKLDDQQDYTFIDNDYKSDPNYNFVKYSRVFDTGDSDDYPLCWSCSTDFLWGVNDVLGKFPPLDFGRF